MFIQNPRASKCKYGTKSVHITLYKLYVFYIYDVHFN